MKSGTDAGAVKQHILRVHAHARVWGQAGTALVAGVLRSIAEWTLQRRQLVGAYLVPYRPLHLMNYQHQRPSSIWLIATVPTRETVRQQCVDYSTLRGRSQLSTSMKAYREYSFYLTPPPPQKRTLICLFFQSDNISAPSLNIENGKQACC